VGEREERRRRDRFRLGRELGGSDGCSRSTRGRGCSAGRPARRARGFLAAAAGKGKGRREKGGWWDPPGGEGAREEHRAAAAVWLARRECAEMAGYVRVSSFFSFFSFLFQNINIF
jgi:hypothetical protein